MKHITELIQKQVVKKHSRALMFYLFLLIAAAILAWISQSLYISLFIVAFLAALAVRLIQAVHELGQVKRFTQSLRGPQRLLYRQGWRRKGSNHIPLPLLRRKRQDFRAVLRQSKEPRKAARGEYR